MQKSDNNLAGLPMTELRLRWAKQWGIAPHWRIGRQMLVKSIEFKLREARGEGMTAEQRKRLDGLVAAYKRNPKTFDQGPANLKPGTKLVRGHGGVKHVVLVKTDGFEYRNKTYTSLSEIAHAITGTRWSRGRLVLPTSPAKRPKAGRPSRRPMTTEASPAATWIVRGCKN